MTNPGGAAQKLAAMEDVLDALTDPPSVDGTETAELLAYLERWGRIKKATAYEAIAEIEDELDRRGEPRRSVDVALGDLPGNAWQRHKKREAAAGRATPEPLPGTSLSEFADELGLTTALSVRRRINNIGPAEWWGSFKRNEDGKVIRVTDPERQGKGEIRILDAEGYKAAAGKPGRKPKVQASESSDSKN